MSTLQRSLTQRSSRLFAATALAAMLSVAFTGLASADSEFGQVGNYLFTDTAESPMSTCRYNYQAPNHLIYRIVTKPPSAWWMNTNADVTTQHGHVGWRVIVKDYDNGTVLAKSPIQHKTAYEDQLNPYGNGTKAPFTSIAINVSHAWAAKMQLTARVNWYRNDGSIKGYVLHDVGVYRTRFGDDFGLLQADYCRTVQPNDD